MRERRCQERRKKLDKDGGRPRRLSGSSRPLSVWSKVAKGQPKSIVEFKCDVSPRRHKGFGRFENLHVTTYACHVIGIVKQHQFFGTSPCLCCVVADSDHDAF